MPRDSNRDANDTLVVVSWLIWTGVLHLTGNEYMIASNTEFC